MKKCSINAPNGKIWDNSKEKRTTPEERRRALETIFI